MDDIWWERALTNLFTTWDTLWTEAEKHPGPLPGDLGERLFAVQAAVEELHELHQRRTN